MFFILNWIYWELLCCFMIYGKSNMFFICSKELYLKVVYFFSGLWFIFIKKECLCYEVI